MPVRAQFSAEKRVARNNLLAKPDAALLAMLDALLAATARVFPVPSSRRQDLPDAIRDLSHMLTNERSALVRSYWATPRLFSAYLHFFLPWNLLRLFWLFPGLDLPLSDGARLLDLGSGPLTLPLALWCARPETRSLALEFTCSDMAAKPMETGLRILRDLSGNTLPWRITLLRTPVKQALRATKPFDCIMAGNVLNELATISRDSQDLHLSRSMEDFIAMALPSLTPGGRLLLVEPGTRLGGKLIALARNAALRRGASPLVPCTHNAPCPMLNLHRHKQEKPVAPGSPSHHRPEFSGWCHFIHPAMGAPQALMALGKKARLQKNSLALSCLLLKKDEQNTFAPSDEKREAVGSSVGDLVSTKKVNPHHALRNYADLDDLDALYQEIMAEDRQESSAAKGQGKDRPPCNPAGKNRAAPPVPSSDRALVRVISAPIRLPNCPEPARYACCEKGIALLLNALRIPSGAGASMPWPLREKRDAKTGALFLERPEG